MFIYVGIYILEINRFNSTPVYYVYIGTQDNNYYQTVALTRTFEETLVLPWGACSPQLTTNVFFLYSKESR